MKAFGKWLVMARVKDSTHLAHPGFKTKRDAIETLTTSGFKRLSDNLWTDSNGQHFFITKNVIEY